MLKLKVTQSIWDILQAQGKNPIIQEQQTLMID